MRELSPGVRRLLALGLLVLFLLTFYLYLLSPVWRYYADGLRQVGLHGRQLAQFEFLVENEDRFDEELARMEEADTGGDLFLAGSKPAIASANMQEFVTEEVRKAGGELVSSQEYEADSIDATTAIGLQVQVRCEVQNLVRLMHAIETARPAVFIDEINVDSSSGRTISARDARRGRKKDSAPSLEVRLNIVGYMVGEQGAEDADAI